MHRIFEYQRYGTLAFAVCMTVICLIVGIMEPWVLWLAVAFGGLTALGIYDTQQTHHAVTKNYPILGHIRFLFEKIRPEIRQYLIESDKDEQPFSREQRSLVYQRAKGAEDKRPFGSHEQVYEAGYSWLTHSVEPTKFASTDFRVTIGGPDCKHPYDASLYNISAMSFGALSANAILA